MLQEVAANFLYKNTTQMITSDSRSQHVQESKNRCCSEVRQGVLIRVCIRTQLSVQDLTTGINGSQGLPKEILDGQAVPTCH